MVASYRHFRSAVACLAVVLTHADIGRADEGDIPVKQKFVVRLKEAVRADDKVWLADHAHYPMRFYGHKTRMIRNKPSFLRYYPSMIGSKLRAGILAQDPEQVFENYQGMMLGDGATNIWVRAVGDGTSDVFEIVTINDEE